jgi:hypothetical protein
MRRLCWNLETGAVTLSITSGQSIGTLRVKRHDLEDLEVVPYRSSTGAACDLPSGASLVFALKETSTDTVLLTSCVSWTLAANTYSGTVSLNTTEIDDAFDAAPTATEIPCVAELIYVIAGQQRSSQTITAQIDDDVYSGTEGTPTPGTPGYPTALNVPELLTGGHSALRAVITAAGATGLGKIIVQPIGGIAQWWQLSTGTTADDDISVIRPTDYATTTNEQIWLRIG